MSTYAQSTTTTNTSSSSNSSSRPAKSPILSSGRGGSGNKRPKSVLKLDLGDEAEILQKRRLEASLNPRVKVKYTGRGGSGNIRAASVAQSIPFDISADPDDDYERIVLLGAQKAKKEKTPSTGRGGLGNFSRPRSKSLIAANGASKGKKEKSRRRRSTTSSSRFSASTTSTDYYELERIVKDTSSLSLDIPARVVPAMDPPSLPPTSKSSSSLPTPPPSSPSAPYLPSTKASKTPSLNASMRKMSSGLSLLPVVASSATRSAPSSPLRLKPHNGSGLSLPPPSAFPVSASSPSSSAPSSPLRSHPHSASSLPLHLPRAFTAAESTPSLSIRRAEQSTTSLSSLPSRASTSSLGLPSPPASPITPDTSPILVVAQASSSVTDSKLNATPHKLQKARNHDISSKWWKMGGRRRVQEKVAPTLDVAPVENVRSSVDVSPSVGPVDSHTPEEKAMAHLQEVGMHAMEIRMRMREERLSIIRNSQRYPPPQPQELDDNTEHVIGDEASESEPYPLPSVPEEDGEFVSFLDFE